jgi:hypothetical protein
VRYLVDGAADDRGQARGLVLQHIVRRPLLDKLDRGFVSKHSGQEDER